MNNSVIYLDNAATTPLSPSVFKAMEPFLGAEYFNASSSYQPAQNCRAAIEDARSFLARTLGARPAEVMFTSGGTEADNWALKGLALAHKKRGKHLIVSSIEHHAVLESAHWLEQQGFEVTYLPVTSGGTVSAAALESALRADTVLVSIMAANNEVGTLEPIKELAACAHKQGALFHTDAVQAYGRIPLCVSELDVDALAISAHKIHGPKGVGLLYRRRGVSIEPLLHGGAQERGYRAGTENVAGIVGFANAAKALFETEGTKDSQALAFSSTTIQAIKMQAQLRNYLIEQLQAIPDVYINALSAQRLPGIVSASFRGLSAETLLMCLDQVGICVSAGSACASGSLEPSHVLVAMGLDPHWAQGTIRFSFSEQTTKEELDYALVHLKEIVERLRGV